MKHEERNYKSDLILWLSMAVMVALVIIMVLCFSHIRTDNYIRNNYCPFKKGPTNFIMWKKCEKK